SLTVFFAQDLTGSIRRLIRSADRISSGKFEFINTNGATDEFSELAMAFNQVSTKLRSAMEATEEERKVRDEALDLLESVRGYVDKMVVSSNNWFKTLTEHRQEFQQYPALSQTVFTQVNEQLETGEQVK